MGLSKEPAKVAITSSRTICFIRAAIHLPALAGCVILLLLNRRATFVPSYHKSYTALQFVAKLHEILLQASISAVALAYVRNRLIGRSSMPFGAFLGLLQVTRISYLWSLEFWSTLFANWLSHGERLLFFLLMAVSFLLAASVGPSSAVLMVPRQITKQNDLFMAMDTAEAYLVSSDVAPRFP